ncbi:MAG: hypothetical protein ACLU5E_01460 [Anaerovoracaceae bacterium]
MATQEVSAVTRVKNDSGEYIVYPATKAENAAYDNSTSGLTADDVQGAIDEIAEQDFDGSLSNYTKKETTAKLTSDLAEVAFQLELTEMLNSKRLEMVAVDVIEAQDAVTILQGNYKEEKVYI